MSMSDPANASCEPKAMPPPLEALQTIFGTSRPPLDSVLQDSSPESVVANPRIAIIDDEGTAAAPMPGDVLQLTDGTRFYHSPVIVSVGWPARPDTILVAAHTLDADNRPLSTYRYAGVRFLHILGVRRPG